MLKDSVIFMFSFKLSFSLITWTIVFLPVYVATAAAFIMAIAYGGKLILLCFLALK